MPDLAILSTMLLPAWSCCATMFPSFYGTLPVDDITDAPFDLFLAFVARASGPALGPDKDLLPFFVPCALQPAPYTPGTAAKLGVPVGTIGLQRDRAHVTVAMMIVADADGLSRAELDALLELLRQVGLTFICYSTHSNGRPDKPGTRARLIVPVDRPMDVAGYKLAWIGFDQMFCGGAIAAKDASGMNLYQQQGVWSADRLRHEAGLTFRHVHRAGVACADVLIAEGRKICPPSSSAAAPGQSRVVWGEAERRKVLAAIGVISADSYAPWIKVCACMVELSDVLGEDMRKWWLAYCERGDEASKANNDRSGTNPEVMFDAMTPTMGPDAALGTLMALAKEDALETVRPEVKARRLSERGRVAVEYLSRYHRAALDAMQAECKEGK